MMHRLILILNVVMSCQLLAGNSMALAQVENAETSKPVIDGDPAKGRELLLNKLFLPRDFHQSVLDEVWRDWPEPMRSMAEKSDKQKRRQMTFSRYGFTPREDNPELPKQFAVDNEGWYAMNCFACHGGQVAGKAYDGLPNSRIALETMYEDMRKTKSRMKVSLSGMDVGRKSPFQWALQTVHPMP